MRPLMKFALASAFVCAATTATAAEKISIRDYCDASDPAWAPTGGCVLEEGDVTVAEFNALLTSMLSTAVVGHPAWRFQPSFTEIEPGDSVRVSNDGGRPHTFTEVAQFGGGMIPPLSKGLIEAPECATATVIPAGGRTVIRGLAEGTHLFQCCIHPWMHELVKVQREADR
ncbi:MAG TPA: hypothetical protein VN858_12500 [Casimicrobiaceae bacterium]|nr:hypothetical protein [Casimicrobiaceae bacterium]